MNEKYKDIQSIADFANLNFDWFLHVWLYVHAEGSKRI